MDVADVHVEPWRAKAACRDLDPALWYPQRSDGNPMGRAGKDRCRSCPVVTDCLEHALAKREKQGIWGGASTRRRRVLLVAFLQRAHDFDAGCRNRSCRWCPVVREHLAELAGESDGPVDLNGPSATHGRRSTYARGCREARCVFAISAVGTEFDREGWDIPTWWAETFGDADGLELVDIAKLFAEVLLEQQAA